ncbi:SDR family NAD(P)-dependent oxidoreductase [Pseudarthrobacter sp. NamE2]|uniref:SDR family NAD(P)-dependent oxidoreductase n=1 Tax=Pseudarthrobacter sp. NamE2 TaxID=2576838 RepID=UPI0010FE7411|nr:SDR family NAD(P)-dependent oxidoreductase [Pseudarthrobacter sp. NamE2]TLM83378.1 SDR family NAD(P)-dependent oxidoreductase [Pseudarthrobacter sp. NamE2]
MRYAGGGTIINIGSVAGRRGWANAGAYCASRFALTGLTQSLAAEGQKVRHQNLPAVPRGYGHAMGRMGSLLQRPTSQRRRSGTAVTAPGHLADLITWIALSPREMLLNEVTVTPLLEEGWP